MILIIGDTGGRYGRSGCDMIEHQINSLAKGRDNADLTKGMRWCITNNRDCSVSAAARKKVLENYTIERVGELYKRVYEGMKSPV